ncbi:baseplate J/gp47 family protein [Cedecea sp. MMO-103]|uniref:baseplate J/gp47 family protein n=1 Tax=Cedecea sp. MMO-103 TaxID=3081238 RepID=UPI00301B4071
MALNLDTLGLSATVTAQGITAPDYQTVLSTISGYFRQIYGADAYLEPDSKDGQMVSLVALAIHDANNTAIQVYNSFSPLTAQDAALSNNVKINGITRKVATKSSVDLTIGGIAGTTITNGSVKDLNGVTWLLPAVVNIGIDGTAIVTANAASNGAIAALPGTVTVISTPTRGWSSVTNMTAATVGRPAETDAELRVRQAQSVALSAITPFDALNGALAQVSGVIRHKLYENDTASTDSNGLPANSISAIVDGGDATEIAKTIRNKKAPGVPTFGKSHIDIPNAYGILQTIYFSRPTSIPIFVAVELQALPGYTSSVGVEIQESITKFINDLGIGKSVLLSRLYSPANLTSGIDSINSQYYDILSLKIGLSDKALSTSNIDITYDSLASCVVGNVSIKVTS